MNETIAPVALHGWYVLHQFFRVASVAGEPDGADSDDAADVAELFKEWENLGAGGWSGLYRMVGGGIDLMAVHFRTSLDGLGEAERALRNSDLAGRLFPAGDYVSVVELGLYSHTSALLRRAEAENVQPGSDTWSEWVTEAMEQEREKQYVRRRLFPRQPEDMPYVCFYPMDKRRRTGQNWYALSVHERADLMLAHGATGRRWAGRVSQIISGSVGLDDWEWAVTLFSGDPLEFKDLVTEMRYDEASSVYAEFGSFWVGRRVPTEAIGEELEEL